MPELLTIAPVNTVIQLLRQDPLCVHGVVQTAIIIEQDAKGRLGYLVISSEKIVRHRSFTLWPVSWAWLRPRDDGCLEHFRSLAQQVSEEFLAPAWQ